MNIPLFIFNFTDYKIWEKYANELRGKKTKKGDPVGVASLKFKIMMQICSDNYFAMNTGKLPREEGFEWTIEDVKNHQEKMIHLLFQKNN